VLTTRTTAIPPILDEAALVGGALMLLGVVFAFIAITAKWGKI
jgi:hypothetical protein